MYKQKFGYFTSYTSQFKNFVNDEIDELVELIESGMCPSIMFSNETFGAEAQKIIDNDFFLDLLKLNYPNLKIFSEDIIDTTSENGGYTLYKMELRKGMYQ